MEKFLGNEPGPFMRLRLSPVVAVYLDARSARYVPGHDRTATVLAVDACMSARMSRGWPEGKKACALTPNPRDHCREWRHETAC